MFVVRTGPDPNLLQQSMMAGILQAERERIREEDAERQAKTMLQKILLEDEMTRRREREKGQREFKEKMFLKGASYLPQEEQQDIGAYGPPSAEAGYLSDPYGGYWRRPQAPNVPEGFVAIQKPGTLGEYEIKERPGFKPGSKEEALELKAAGRAPQRSVEDEIRIRQAGRAEQEGFGETFFDPDLNGYFQKSTKTGKLHKVSGAEMEPNQAYRRLSDIEKSKAELEKGNEVTQILIALNPQLNALSGAKLSEADKRTLYERWDAEASYLQKYLSKYPGQGKPGGNVIRYDAQGNRIQ